MMFQHLIKENGLMADLELYGLNSTDVDFIKEQIAGPLELDTAVSQPDSVRVISTVHGCEMCMCISSGVLVILFNW